VERAIRVEERSGAFGLVGLIGGGGIKDGAILTSMTSSRDAAAGTHSAHGNAAAAADEGGELRITKNEICQLDRIRALLEKLVQLWNGN
jgi:hypothetical protein